jgi:hypothetical protein
MKRALVLGLALGAALLGGCGPSGPPRSSYQGKVTYEGKPVVYGLLCFKPDTARGNKGVFGVAEINDGVYQTDPDYGPSPGPMLVSVQVFDAKPPSNRSIANIIDLPVDFSSPTASRDIHVTARDIKPITN